MGKTESISDERLAEFVDNPSHYSSEIFKMASELQFRRAANSDGGVEPVAWVTPDILAALKRGERAVPGWKQSADFNIPLYAGHPPARALDGIAVTDDVYDLRKAAEFLLWQYDRQGPLAESTEAWEQLRSALK